MYPHLQREGLVPAVGGECHELLPPKVRKTTRAPVKASERNRDTAASAMDGAGPREVKGRVRLKSIR